MRGKTNALHELRDVSSIELTTGEMGVVYLPEDYGVSYFSKVTTQRDNSLIKGFCENLPHELTPINTAGITSIRTYAFRYDTGVTSIHFADSVLLISSNSFYGTSVRTLDTGAGLGDMGERSFDSCTSLTSVYIHGHNTVVRNYAFNNCTNLKTVVFEGTNDIKSSVFYNDYRLGPVVIPECTTNVGDYCFAVNSDSTAQNNLDPNFHVVVRRKPQFVQGSTTTLNYPPTKLGYACLNNRMLNTTRKLIFFPWEWYLVYRNYSNNQQAAVWNNAGVWIDAEAGETLPTTSRQVYGSLSADYTLVWYSDADMQNQVSVAPEAGTYYGIIQEVS